MNDIIKTFTRDVEELEKNYEAVDKDNKTTVKSFEGDVLKLLASLKRHQDKEGNEDEILLVPGKVLGVGRTKKSLTVVAYKFSKTAKKHLEKNGKTMTIQEALEKHSEGKNMRILA